MKSLNLPEEDIDLFCKDNLFPTVVSYKYEKYINKSNSRKH